MLGGRGRGPLTTPVDYDALLIGDAVDRQLAAAVSRRAGGTLSRFVEAPLRVSPVQLAKPQTIPVGGPLPVLHENVPNIVSPQVTIGR